MDTRPCYQRRRPSRQDPKKFQTDRIDLSSCHLPPYPHPDPSGAPVDSRPLANSLFDARAAAAVSAAVGDLRWVTIPPQSGDLDPKALLERKNYGDDAPTILIPTPKCLAAMAYKDYFPDAPGGDQLRSFVSDAIMLAQPGWCGTYGPGIDDGKPKDPGGDYDQTQMFLLPLAYAYYDELRPEAQEKLITKLLQGRIRRDNEDDTFTVGPAPNNWWTAGHFDIVVPVADIPETENHVFMIATARYLANQLAYPREYGRLHPVSLIGPPLPDPSIAYDNRRNANAGGPSCMDQILSLLRYQLRDDFAEYNAKPYQEQTRHALLNLASYAYDAEVRLAARMVLDYVSAHIAVSSCDLRRMVPFRRRNEPEYARQDPGESGFMDVNLLDGHFADPMPAHFALHAGNTRAFRFPDNRVWPGEPSPARPWEWAIAATFGDELVLEAICDWRLAPSVHDLFVNDLHRRFFQRLHRHSMMEEPGQQRNCENMEIYCGSPSYLISAGGRPAIWVIPGKAGHGYEAQNLGVAVPISFMPAGSRAMSALASTSDSRDLIEIMHFSDVPGTENGIHEGPGATENYGVAPDFACGIGAHFPVWTGIPAIGDGLFFVDGLAEASELPHFYLAVHRWGEFVILEAFDKWRHPEEEFTYEAFQTRVRANSPSEAPVSGRPAIYTTFFGNRIHYLIWNKLEFDNHILGSKILDIEYGAGDPTDTLADAGKDTDSFLSGTIMKSPLDGKVEIHNPSLGTTLTLDWSNEGHLIRISETGEVEQAGFSFGKAFEVWVDFNWQGPMEGDFYRPFNSLAAALNAVADGGVIRIMPGARQERLTIHKRVRLKAPGGTVTVRAR